VTTNRLTTILILGALICLAPSRAHADGLFTPWLGVNFANDPADGRTSFGFTATAMGGGVIGGEFDFGYSPNFFGDENVFGSNNVLTVVGNLVLGIPLGGSRGFGFRPYGTVGVGLIRAKGEDIFEPDASSNEFGINAGGGAFLFFGDHVGMRGDLRYFRAGFDDLNFFNTDKVDFWRASIGVTFR
jgi:opacity protein-like surface antigen